MSATRAWPARLSAPGAAPVQALVLAASFACILPGLVLSCVILAARVVTAHGWGLLLAFSGEAMARPDLLAAASTGAGVTLVALFVWWPRLLRWLVFATGMASTAINFVVTPSIGDNDLIGSVIGLGLLGTFIAALAMRWTSRRSFHAEAATPGVAGRIGWLSSFGPTK